MGIGSNGNDYFVVFTVALEPARAELRGVRVRADGTPIDTAPLVLGPAAEKSAAVGWDGSNYLVVSSDTTNGDQDLPFSRVTPNGVCSTRVAVRSCSDR